MQPRTRALAAGVLTIIASAPAWAALDADSARAVIEELLVQSADGPVPGQWVLDHVELPLSTAASASARRRAERLVVRRFQDGPLAESLAAGPTIAGVVPGPDYQRVVLDSEPPLTFVLREGDQGPAIVDLGTSTCSLCSEPERWVRDLLRDLDQPGGAGERLVVGAELRVSPEHPEGWRRSVHLRNVDAGWLRFAYQGATVRAVEGSVVTLDLPGGEDVWSLVWEGRWMLDYEALPESSPLVLPDDTSGEHWARGATQAEATPQWWLPFDVDRGSGRVLADDVLFLAHRPLQDDLLVYRHDLSRRWAFVATFDPASGEVADRVVAPTLPFNAAVDPKAWRGSWHGAASRDGRWVVVGRKDRIWRVDVTGGAVESLGAARGLVGLAMSPSGDSVLVAERSAVRRVDVRTGDILAQAERRGMELVDVEWDQGVIWLIEASGAMHGVDASSLEPVHERTACCGEAQDAALNASRGELLVVCGLSCDAASVWVGDPYGAGAPRWYAGPAVGSEGLVSADPEGRWVIVPAVGGGAALLDAEDGRWMARLSDRALRQILWSADADRIWALDDQGTVWEWSVEELLAPD